MDKLSFSSVYRTAVILAAFSQASAASDVPARDAPWDSSGPVSSRSGAWYLSARNALARFMARLPQTGKTADEEPTRPGSQHGAGNTYQIAEPVSDAPLVSHFAFWKKPHRPGEPLETETA